MEGWNADTPRAAQPWCPGTQQSSVALIALGLMVGMGDARAAIDGPDYTVYHDSCPARPALRLAELTMPEVSGVVPSEFKDGRTFSNTVYRALLSLGLSARGAELLTAHMAFSTGWGKSARGYNFTGLKAGDKSACYGGAPASGNYMCLCAFEYKNGQAAAGCSDCTPSSGGTPRCKYPFRAFTSLAEGLSATVSLLRSSRHASAYALLVAGNTQYYRALGNTGWYTANPDDVYKGCIARLEQVREYLTQGAPPVLAGLPLAPLVVGAVGWFALRWYLKRRG